MKIPSFANPVKKLFAFMPKQDIEKLLFKALLGMWVVIILVAVIIGAVLVARDDIERRIMETATSGKTQVIEKSDTERYESMLNLAKSPEEIKGYTSAVKRDPFSEYKKEFAIHPSASIKYDFVLKSVSRIQLPLVYRGYIELPDRIIGQINWHDATRFLTASSTIGDYRIHSISKEKIIATDEKGRKVEFRLNKPVFGDELQAILYDNLSKKTFIVFKTSKIDDYEVIEISRNYVILRSNETEIKLEKSP